MTSGSTSQHLCNLLGIEPAKWCVFVLQPCKTSWVAAKMTSLWMFQWPRPSTSNLWIKSKCLGLWAVCCLTLWLSVCFSVPLYRSPPPLSPSFSNRWLVTLHSCFQPASLTPHLTPLHNICQHSHQHSSYNKRAPIPLVKKRRQLTWLPMWIMQIIILLVTLVC